MRILNFSAALLTVAISSVGMAKSSRCEVTFTSPRLVYLGGDLRSKVLAIDANGRFFRNMEVLENDINGAIAQLASELQNVGGCQNKRISVRHVADESGR